MDEDAGSQGSLVVVGAGGLGRETAVWATRAGFEVVGFLDADPARHGGQVGDHQVLGDLSWLPPSAPGVPAAPVAPVAPAVAVASGTAADEAGPVGVVVAIGGPRRRRAVTAQVLAQGHRVVTVWDPDAVVGPRVEVGAGSILCPRVTITCDARLGAGVVASVGASIHHDDVIGDHVFLGPGVALSGNVTIGAGAWIGIGATVRQGVSIGAGTMVGAGAVVVADLPDDVVAVGVPARVTAAQDQPW